MLLLSLSGLLIGSNINAFVVAQSVPEYVPVLPRKVAKSVADNSVAVTSAPTTILAPITDPAQLMSPQFGYLVAPVSSPLNQEAISSMLETEGEGAYPLPPSMTEGLQHLVPQYSNSNSVYDPTEVTIASAVSYESPVDDSNVSQALDTESAPSDDSEAVPGRFQMALERTNSSNKVIVVVCDTATGRCWSGQVGSSKWKKMGTPIETEKAEIKPAGESLPEPDQKP